MIAIVNITQPCEPSGVHTYSVRINRQEVCQFEHKRETGLAECLMLAAKAVEKQKWMNASELLKYMQST